MKRWREIIVPSDKIFFTADLHFGHKNMIEKCSQRPFKNIEEMEETICRNWNKVVPNEGLVFVLGDIVVNAPTKNVPRILDKLNGEKQLILGNHDYEEPEFYIKSGFSRVGHYDEIIINDQKIVLCHYPMVVWNSSYRGTWMIHGHCHGSLRYFDEIRKKIKQSDNLLSLKTFDVGIDTSKDFNLYSFNDLKNFMDNTE